MTTFYICRHGQTENNQNQRLSGWVDTPLTELGVKNAESTASKLKDIAFDKIISSDLGRAFVSAYIISRIIGFDSEIERNKGLREVRYGVLANMPYSSYPKLKPTENADFVPENGESLTQMQQRVMNCINEISTNNPSKTILLVAHDGPIKAVKASFTNQNIGIVDSTGEFTHDSVAKFVIDNSHIVSFADFQNR